MHLARVRVLKLTYTPLSKSTSSMHLARVRVLKLSADLLKLELRHALSPCEGIETKKGKKRKEHLEAFSPPRGHYPAFLLLFTLAKLVHSLYTQVRETFHYQLNPAENHPLHHRILSQTISPAKY